MNDQAITEQEYGEDLARARQEAQLAERAHRQKMLREKGRLPEQAHIGEAEFGAVLILALFNDVLDFIEIPADMSLVFLIPLKAVFISIDATTAILIMLWGATRAGSGFFGTRRIVGLMVTVLAEFTPIVGVIPGWTIFIALEMMAQRFREATVRRIAKKHPEKAERAAVRLQATQAVLAKRASGLGKQAMHMNADAPSLRGTSSRSNRVAARDVRMRSSSVLAPEVERQIIKPAHYQFGTATGSGTYIERGLPVAGDSQYTAGKTTVQKDGTTVRWHGNDTAVEKEVKRLEGRNAAQRATAAEQRAHTGVTEQQDSEDID